MYALTLLALVLTTPAAPTGKTSLQAPFSPSSHATAQDAHAVGDKIIIEQCDGTRAPAQLPPTQATKQLKCERWTLKWTDSANSTRVWGQNTASEPDVLAFRRDKIQGFARQQAGLFERIIPARYAVPGPLVCEVCPRDGGGASGLWGDGQKFGAIASRKALKGADATVNAFRDQLFDVHMPRLRDVVRFTHEPKTARVAKQYATQLDASVTDLLKTQLAIDAAATFRSTKRLDKAVAALKRRKKSLDKAADALMSLVAKEVKRAHAGKYSQPVAEGTGSAEAEVIFDGAKVTVTYKLGTTSALWFEGRVELDGRIAGKSLLAPAAKKLTCTDYKLECGYEQVPALLRFIERSDGATGQRHRLELWFQRAEWIPAAPFFR